MENRKLGAYFVCPCKPESLALLPQAVAAGGISGILGLLVGFKGYLIFGSGEVGAGGSVEFFGAYVADEALALGDLICSP